MSFTTAEVANAVMWGLLVAVMALGYMCGRMR